MIMTMKNNENTIVLNSDPIDPKVVRDTKTDRVFKMKYSRK